MRICGALLTLAMAFLAPGAAAKENKENSAASSHRVHGACPAAWPDRLEGLTPEGDLVLASERLAMLSGLRLPEEGPHRGAALAWLRARIGQDILVRGLPERDRWNRLSVRIEPANAAERPDFAQSLVESGLAIVDLQAGDPSCQRDLFAFEASARARSLGLWSDDRYKPVNAEQLDRLRDRLGRFVLVEGRVRSVGVRAQRTYLNFGRDWAEDFTVIIPRRTWKLMAEHGLDAAALKGRRIRARGILEPWQGAALTIVVPQMIERLPH